MINETIVLFAKLWGMYEVEGGDFRDALECNAQTLLETVLKWAKEYEKSSKIKSPEEFFEKKLKTEFDLDI